MIEQARQAALLDELRDEFDRARCLPQAPAAEEAEERLLAIRVSGVGCAIRLGEVAALTLHRGLLRVPSRVPELLGIGVIRGACTPIYNLASLLAIDDPAPRVPHGRPIDTRNDARNDARWIALCGAEERIGLAFEQLDGFLSVSPADIFPVEQTESEHSFVWHLMRQEGNIRPVISIQLIREAIEQRCGRLNH